LNIPRSKTAKLLEIVDERSTDIYRLLVKEGKVFTFLPGRVGRKGELIDDEDIETDSDDALVGEQFFAFDEDVDKNASRAEHQDTKLQTRL
ncbi:hypothetical protein I1A39_21020, partial [Pectobacterium carotovorum]|nr:hypothetical protein [Pectobacterium carotovorum]MCH4990417.1 hypothetical protein [Pectobacterium carotovorum]